MNEEAWDCDLFTEVTMEPYDLEIDEEGDDWQVIALDRFYDRQVNAELR